MAVAENSPKRPWKQIAKEASRETDPKKLLALAEELGRALNKQQETTKKSAQ
jgi:hypothetical protein